MGETTKVKGKREWLREQVKILFKDLDDDSVDRIVGIVEKYPYMKIRNTLTLVYIKYFNRKRGKVEKQDINEIVREIEETIKRVRF